MAIASLVDEALLAFRLSAGLFDLLDETTLETTDSLIIGGVSKSLQGLTFPLSQVIVFIAAGASSCPLPVSFLVSMSTFGLAVCLSHFILVVGGFTGDSGYQKWIALQHWITTLWQSTVE